MVRVPRTNGRRGRRPSRDALIHQIAIERFHKAARLICAGCEPENVGRIGILGKREEIGILLDGRIEHSAVILALDRPGAETCKMRRHEANWTGLL